MKLTAFLGSPRAGGNTDTLAGRIVAGARDAGLDTEIIALRKLKIAPCVGCEKCWERDAPCVIKDDALPLYQAIAGSDILLFATPVYWYGPTTIMKAFMDRWVVFNRPQGRPLIQGKRAILVSAYEEEDPCAAEPLIRMFELSFEYLGVELMDSLVVGGLGPKDAAHARPDLLDRAYVLGTKLSA